MGRYPRAAVERAMKMQEVILRAISKQITWWQAAEIIGMSDRHMRRCREQYERAGFDGLLDRRRCRPSEKRVPLATVERVLSLYREQYADFNVRHFHEKLAAEHGITLSYTWVKAALQGAGLVAKRSKRGSHRKRRPRRPLPGMLLHIDGSRHRWFQDERWYDLLAILDDASSDMKKTAETTKTATHKAGANPHQMKGVMSAVKAVVGEEPDTFADVDEHPGSLDLPTQKPKTTKLLADCRRLPKGSAERSEAFRKLLKVLHDEYAK